MDRFAKRLPQDIFRFYHTKHQLRLHYYCSPVSFIRFDEHFKNNNKYYFVDRDELMTELVDDQIN